MDRFASDVLARLPLAEALGMLLRYVLDRPLLDDLFEQHRGTGSEQKVTFPLLVKLITDALVQHGGSARQSFATAREADELAATDAAVYGKLRRIPPAMSEAFLERTTRRLRAIMPEGISHPIPPALRDFQVLVVDGKKLKKLPKRLKPLRGVSGKVLAGKVVVGLLLNEGLVVTMNASPDGEANDAPLTPSLIEHCCQQFPNRHLYVADRQFCDLKIPRLIDSLNHAFVIRYSRKMTYFPERQQESRDPSGRIIREAWGFLGRPQDARRIYLRQITLVRGEGEENIVVLTNLLNEQEAPADQLLELYLARWSIERVFQKITQVFELQQLIASSPQGAIFQFALCALLYNLVQVIRGSVAEVQQRPSESLSTEMIFGDVRKQLTATVVLLPQWENYLDDDRTAAQVKAQLPVLLQGQWSPLWVKTSSKKKRAPPTRRNIPGGHSSGWKLIQQAKRSPPR